MLILRRIMRIEVIAIITNMTIIETSNANGNAADARKITCGRSEREQKWHLLRHASRPPLFQAMLLDTCGSLSGFAPIGPAADGPVDAVAVREFEVAFASGASVRWGIAAIRAPGGPTVARARTCAAWGVSPGRGRWGSPSSDREP